MRVDIKIILHRRGIYSFVWLTFTIDVSRISVMCNAQILELWGDSQLANYICLMMSRVSSCLSLSLRIFTVTASVTGFPFAKRLLPKQSHNRKVHKKKQPRNVNLGWKRAQRVARQTFLYAFLHFLQLRQQTDWLLTFVGLSARKAMAFFSFAALLENRFIFSDVFFCEKLMLVFNHFNLVRGHACKWWWHWWLRRWINPWCSGKHRKKLKVND